MPLTKPIVLQGGFEGAGTGIVFFGASNGETLSPTPQPVPGGLLGFPLPGDVSALVTEALAVTATIELAGPSRGRTEIGLNTSNLLEAKGAALTLPVVVRLTSPLLGDECVIGSSTDPIEVALTSGRSGSLHGSPGELSSSPSGTTFTVKGAKLVDADFSVGAATGCGGAFSAFVDPLVNVALGLPTLPGRSSAVLEAELQTGYAEALRGH